MLFTGSLLHRSEHVYTGLLHTCNSMYQNSWHRPVKIHRLSYRSVLYNNQVCNRYQHYLLLGFCPYSYWQQMVLALVRKVWEAPRMWLALLTHFWQRWNNALFVPTCTTILQSGHHMTMKMWLKWKPYEHERQPYTMFHTRSLWPLCFNNYKMNIDNNLGRPACMVLMMVCRFLSHTKL